MHIHSNPQLKIGKKIPAYFYIKDNATYQAISHSDATLYHFITIRKQQDTQDNGKQANSYDETTSGLVFKHSYQTTYEDAQNANR